MSRLINDSELANLDQHCEDAIAASVTVAITTMDYQAVRERLRRAEAVAKASIVLNREKTMANLAVCDAELALIRALGALYGPPWIAADDPRCPGAGT